MEDLVFKPAQMLKMFRCEKGDFCSKVPQVRVYRYLCITMS